MYIGSNSPTLQRQVPADMMDTVAHVVGSRWRHLGSELGLSEFELGNSRLQALRSDEKKARYILQTWANRRGSMATTAELLKTCNRIQVKNKLEAELQRKQKGWYT